MILRHTAPRSGKVDTDTHRRSTTNQPTNHSMHVSCPAGFLVNLGRESTATGLVSLWCVGFNFLDLGLHRMGAFDDSQVSELNIPRWDV